MTVAAHVLDRQPAPPALSRAWDYERFGVNVLDLPPAHFYESRLAMNVYGALSGYVQAAGSTVQWTQRNPQAWNMVAKILEVRLQQFQLAEQAES